MVYYQKFVAIKSLKNADFEGVLTSVLKEAQTMQKLCHSNIVTMYGISLPFKDEPLKLVSIMNDRERAKESLQTILTVVSAATELDMKTFFQTSNWYVWNVNSWKCTLNGRITRLPIFRDIWKFRKYLRT